MVRVSIWPFRMSGIFVSLNSKLSIVGFPAGRDLRRTCVFTVMKNFLGYSISSSCPDFCYGTAK